MSSRRLVPVLALALVLAAPAHGATQPKPLDPANLDTSVKPTDDFFRYANGGWMKSHPIPADQTDWGGFTELFENNVAALHGILEDAAAQKNARAAVFAVQVPAPAGIGLMEPQARRP